MLTNVNVRLLHIWLAHRKGEDCSRVFRKSTSALAFIPTPCQSDAYIFRCTFDSQSYELRLASTPSYSIFCCVRHFFISLSPDYQNMKQINKQGQKKNRI